jgi:mRNA interferase MazF
VGHPGLIFRGEVYHVDLGQPVGHEPAFRRPAVVVSVDVLNNGPGGLVVVVPITTAGYGLRSDVELEPASGGLDHASYARNDQLRVVSVERLSSRQAMIGPEQMQAIDQALRFVLDL